MPVIIPSILVNNKEAFIGCYTGLKQSVDMIQLDIADGEFAPNKTWGNPQDIATHTKTKVELHLMVQNPLAEMKKWSSVDQIKRVLIHIESLGNLNGATNFAKEKGWELGLVLNPDTEILRIEPFVEHATVIMFMGVYPGFQGQTFIPNTCTRVRKAKQHYPDKKISVDGGVNKETIPSLMRSGVDIICPGSAIFGNTKTPAENVLDLKTYMANISI